MTTTIAEFRALTTSTILINSFFLKVIVWMCLFTAAGIHRAVPDSSAIQKRIAAQVAASSSIHKEQKEKQERLQPSLALSLPLEIFAFDYFHQKKLPVAMLPRIKKKELLHKKESAASFGENTEEYRNSTAAIVKRSDFAVMETDREDFVLTSFAAPYDYFSHPLRLDYVLEETQIEIMQYKEENVDRLMPSSWIDYVAGCEFHWNCGISFAPGRGDLFLAAGELIIVLLALFSIIVARIIRTSSYRRHRKEEYPIIVSKKKRMVMPPLKINCRTHHPHCRCLCRAKTNKFSIPHAPNGYKRVLVPTPGAKCGAREYIIARESVQHQHVKPLSPNLNNRPTLDPIREVPIGYTRVLAPIPGTKCGERDYIVVLVKESGKLLHEDDAASSAMNIGIQESILPFEQQQHQIIKYAKDHVSWIMPLTREYPAEFFPYAREITHKSNFLHGTVGKCASRLGCFIERIEEEDCIDDHLESLDESNYPSDVHVVDEDDGEDGVQEDVTDVVANSTTTHTTCTVAGMSGRPTSTPSPAPTEDAAADVFSFQADSSCSDDLKMDVGNDDTLQQGGSGYYIDGKGRKRRFSLRVLAKKSARILKD